MRHPSLLVEHRLERVLVEEDADARPTPGRGLHQGSLVVAGPGEDTRPMLADVAGEDRRQVGRPVVERGVEVVVDSFADVDRHGMSGLGRRPDVLGEATHQGSPGAADLLDGLQVVVGEMSLVHLEDRHDLDLLAIEQSDLERPVQGGFNRHVRPDLVARQGRDLRCLGIPHAEVADLRPLTCRSAPGSCRKDPS